MALAVPISEMMLDARSPADPVATIAVQKRAAQALQRLRHLGERRTVAQRTGVALDQRDVALDPTVVPPAAI